MILFYGTYKQSDAFIYKGGLVMNNIGRPKKDNIDTLIKFKTDSDTNDSLNKIAAVLGRSKSDILRGFLDSLSSSAFEEKIPYTSLEIMQAYSDKCWETLHCAGCYFDAETISNAMPAFVSRTYDISPSVYVKYPTYKIVIQSLLGSDINADDCSSIDDLLFDVSNRSKAYLTRYDSLIIPNNPTENFTVADEFSYRCEVVCLNISLEENTACKDRIIQILKNNNLQATAYPSYCYRTAPIKFENDNRFFSVIQ